MSHPAGRRKKPKSRLAHLIPSMIESLSENFDETFARIPLINDAVQKYRKKLENSQNQLKRSSKKSCSNSVTSTSRIKVKRIEKTLPKDILPKVSSKIRLRRFETCLDGDSESTSKETSQEIALSAVNVSSSNKNIVQEESNPEGQNEEGSRDSEFYINEINTSTEDRPNMQPSMIDSNEDLTGSLRTYKVEISVSAAITYELELRKTKKLMTMDETFSSVIIPDFDLQRNCLKDSNYLVIKRRSIMCSEESENTFIWVYSCSCNRFVASIIDSLDAANGYTNSDLGIMKSECKGFDADLGFNLCLHIKSSKSIIEEISCLSAMDAVPVTIDDEVTQLTFDQAKLVVSCDGSIGVIGRKQNHSKCLCCSSLFCCHVLFFKEQQEIDKDNECLKLYADNIARESLQTHPTREYQSISSNKVQFTTNDRGQLCLKNSVFDYLQKSDRFSSILVCEDIDKTVCDTCGGRLVKDSNDIVNLLTLNNIISCEVHQKRCENCFCAYPYDGGNDLILNMGKLLIHHSVLRDYMFHFLHGNSCTLTSYYQTWQLTQESAGNMSFKSNINSNFWRHSWYSFLQLLDFDLSAFASCPKCGDIPEVVVCDATSLGFQRKFVTAALQENVPNAAVYPRYSDHEDRVAIPSRPLREKFNLFINNRLNGNARIDFLRNLKSFSKPIYHVVQWVYDVYRPDTVPKPLIDLFRCIGSSSPVCSYVFPSTFVCDLVMQLCDSGVKGNIEVLRALQNDVPIFYNVLSCLSIETCLPDVFKGLLIYLCDIAQSPFRKANEVTTNCSNNNYKYARFPNLPKVRDRGFFQQDKDSFKNPCRKSYTGHPRLLPGIFTVYCPHGICFGYQVMESQESPNIPFTIFRTRFPNAPKVIIYDNACGLHAYCLNRDPLYFKNTRFLVDRFHWKNHTGCSSGYNISIYPRMKDINSEINEQQNSSTKKLKTQLSYMNAEHFLKHCDFFLWYRNYLKRSKIVQSL